MNYSHEVERMCPIAKGANHGPAPIPEEGRWVKAYQISDISGLSHGIGWCAPQQGACKLTLNVKDGIIEEALVETLGCSGMTHSAAMAGEIDQLSSPNTRTVPLRWRISAGASRWILTAGRAGSTGNWSSANCTPAENTTPTTARAMSSP